VARILIVDDQTCVRELLAEELTFEGYQVALAGDAKSATGSLSFFRPDLIVLDMRLDDADGFGVFEEIKRQNSDMSVIIFTAYDTYREDPRLSRADGYVVKSLFLDELKEKIAQTLKTKLSVEKGIHENGGCLQPTAAQGRWSC